MDYVLLFQAVPRSTDPYDGIALSMSVYDTYHAATVLTTTCTVWPDIGAEALAHRCEHHAHIADRVVDLVTQDVTRVVSPEYLERGTRRLIRHVTSLLPLQSLPWTDLLSDDDSADALVDRSLYCANVHYLERHLAKDCGFWFDRDRKLWTRMLSEQELAFFPFTCTPIVCDADA